MTTEIRLATVRHIDELLPLVRAYHDFEGVVQDDLKRRDAIASLLMTPDFGHIWMIYSDSVLAGYIAITLGYSIEFGGKDGFVDEFFLVEESRGKGTGPAALSLVLEQLKNDDVKALHLEVAQDNRQAQKLYMAAGFRLRDRYHMMSCDLDDVSD
jgi:ribosomal protein S18 acetylase RimI-like enzyme